MSFMMSKSRGVSPLVVENKKRTLRYFEEANIFS